MPLRTDIKKIVVIGSGPIVIGQACEFDYSGTQGAKALASVGYDVVLVNSNPATIMTDPELAERTYVEPLEPDTLTRILVRERPDAILPTLGGQTALNLALALDAEGTLKKLGIELIRASPAAEAVATSCTRPPSSSPRSIGRFRRARRTRFSSRRASSVGRSSSSR